MMVREDGFFRKWKKGIETLSPLAQLKAKRVGFVGQLVGILLALIVIVWSGSWYFSLFLFFVGVVIGVELVGVHQQVKEIERFGGR